MIQLPALNTPQFDWVKSRLHGRAQPVPPIFQPEVAAEAIVWAALDHDTRELYVSWSTLRAVIGNSIAPGLGDQLLARLGYDAQQADEPEDPNRPDNLWTPVDADRDFGAHGRFDAVAHDTSFELRLREQRTAVAWLAVGTAGLVLAWASRRQ